MFAEVMVHLCRRADINMTDDKKQRYFMHSVKEQFFTRLVRDPPSTAADLIKKATAIERALHQRCGLYDCLSRSNPVNAAAITVNTRSSLCDLIREIVGEEIQKLATLTVQPLVASVAEVIRDEIRQAFSSPNLNPEPHLLNYASAVRRPSSVMSILLYR